VQVWEGASRVDLYQPRRGEPGNFGGYRSGPAVSGLKAWSYELSSVPGPTYLSQVSNAIEQASAVILVISPQALGSHQVAREIEAAHELDRPIIPVLQDITHEKYLQRRPEWRLALGAYTSIEVPREGVDAIMHKIVGGLQSFGIEPGEPTSLSKPPPRPQRRLADVVRRPWALAIAAVLVVALVAGVVWVFDSRHDQSGKPRNGDFGDNWDAVDCSHGR
jgi:hypothetical protein